MSSANFPEKLGFSFFDILVYDVFMLDDVDKRILRRLQAEPGIAIPDLADALGLNAGRVSRRIDKLRESGVITGIRAAINWAALGYAVEVSLRFTLDKTVRTAFDEFILAAKKVPEVVEIQTFLGRIDVRLSVIAKDMGHYQQLYRDHILTLPHIADIEALMHVATIKEQLSLPI